MTSSTSTISVAVDAQISIDGDKHCFGKFIDKTTVEKVQNNKGSICGAAHQSSHLVQPGREMVAFTLLLDLTAEVLDTCLPLMSLGAPAANVYTCNESVATFDTIVNKVAANHKYTTCRVGRWAIRGQRGSMPAILQLDCVAATETDNGATTYTPPGTLSSIYTFPDSTFKYGPTAGPLVEYPVDRFAIVSDLNLFKQWNNSTSLTDAVVTVQETFLAVSVPYLSTSKAIYWDNRDTQTDRWVQLGLVSGATSQDTLTYDAKYSQFVSKSPDIVSKLSEIRLPLSWQAANDADNTPPNAFTFTHVNGA